MTSASFTEADLLLALRDCYLPLDRRNIIAANLVRSATLTLDPDAPGSIPRLHAHITLNAPGTDEAANSQLCAQIENRLLGLEAISHVSVTLLPALFPIL